LPTFIKPTVGRVVHYYPGTNESLSQMHAGTPDAKPMAAFVTAVHDDGKINLAVFDADAHMVSRHNVTLVQGDDVPNPEVGHAQWMAYQIEQAEKADAPPAGETTDEVAA
jgi:hypothetical protein